jgi:hypothetical protein
MGLPVKTFLVGLVLTGACGGGSAQSVVGGGGTGAWLPLKVGNHWTYQVTDVDGTISAKIQGVVAEEPVGGVGDSKDTRAFKLVTGNKFADPNGDVSYQALVGSRFVRFRELSVDGKTGALKKEQYFADPWKLRVDVSATNTTAGASWAEAYTEFGIDTPKAGALDAAAPSDDAGVNPPDGGLVTTTSQIQESWQVLAADQLITVPAGTFKTLVTNRIAEGTNKTFWFARGVGKVKETGIGEQTEELTGYVVSP